MKKTIPFGMLLATAGLAQPYSIAWHKIAGQYTLLWVRPIDDRTKHNALEYVNTMN
jgi:hypothetical protein